MIDTGTSNTPETTSIEQAAVMVKRLSFAVSLPEIMEVVTDAARRLLRADGVTFVLRDGDKCFYAEEDAISPLWKGQRFPLEACISGWVMMNGTAAVIEDIYCDPRIPIDAYRSTFVKSLAMVPVRPLDPLAAIGAYWRHRHRPSTAEVDTLQAIADASALAIAHVDLLRAKQAVEEHSRAKSIYLAAASHDLRQPLHSLFLFLEMLSHSSLDDKARALLAHMELALTGMKDMMEGVLDLTRLEAGICEPKIQVVPLSLILQPIISAYEPQAAAKDLLFHWECPDLTVRTDPLLLARMLRNLVDNAVKYTEKGSIALRVSAGAGSAVITVEDTGIGIAADRLTRMLTDGNRMATTPRKSGYGLGFATVQRLSHLLGHSLDVSSEPGRGSIFKVTVPATELVS